jgi:hypothetical protein
VQKQDSILRVPAPEESNLFVSDAPTTDPTAPEPEPAEAAAPAEAESLESAYTPRQIVDDDLGVSFADAIDATMVSVEDGAIVPARSSVSTVTRSSSTSATSPRA